MTAIADPFSPGLPPRVRRLLLASAARGKRSAMLAAIGWALVTACAAMLLECFLDRLAHLHPSWRIAWLALVLLTATAIVARPLARWLRRRVDWLEAAADLERAQPMHGQRLMTVISQVLSEPEYRGSGELVDALIDELNRAIASNPPPVPIAWRRIGIPWCSAVAIFLVMWGLCASGWLNLPRLLQRGLEPWLAIAPVTTTQLRVQPGNVQVMQGQALTIDVHARRLGDEPPMISLSGDGQTWQRSAMTSDASDEFSYQIPHLESDLSYFVQGGDARSEEFRVRVLRIPAVVAFSIHFLYPAKTQLAPATIQSEDPHISAPTGTLATIEMVASEPLKSAAFVGGLAMPLAPLQDPRQWTARVRIDRDRTLDLRMVSDRGVRGMSEISIHAVAQQPPVSAFASSRPGIGLAPRGEAGAPGFEPAIRAYFDALSRENQR